MLASILVLMVAFANGLRAQTEDLQNESKLSVYMDFGTNIAVSSAFINGEYNIHRNADRSLKVNARVGLGYSAVFFGPHGPGVLAGLTTLIGQKSHHFEAGIGAFVGASMEPGLYDEVLSFDQPPFFIPDLHLGYRYQRPEGGLIFLAKGGTMGINLGLGYAF